MDPKCQNQMGISNKSVLFSQSRQQHNMIPRLEAEAGEIPNEKTHILALEQLTKG